MIDYDKLKQLESLFIGLFHLDSNCNLYIKSEKGINGNKVTYYEINGDIYFCIDEAITKLNELTQPEPKYKDCWYVGVGGHPKCTKVLNQNGYVVCDETDLEAIGLHVTAYPTRVELIEAQIKYWSDMREPQDEYCNVSGAKLGKHPDNNTISEYHELVHEFYRPEGTTGCQHENDRTAYLTIPPQWKCIKCGGFYR